MEVRTYRAKSMHEALELVRQDLGPNAAVLHTRERRAGGLLGLLLGLRQIEVTAADQAIVPSRLPPPADGLDLGHPQTAASFQSQNPAERTGEFSPPSSSQTPEQNLLSDLQSMVEELCRRTRNHGAHDVPESLFHLFTDLIESDLDEQLARELIDRVRRELPPGELEDPVLVKARLARLIEAEIRVAPPIRAAAGRRRVVALVGPTGVGKTTTIAKLAANFRLKDRRKVGLITVDTYRIAAVEQLRTYAEIIDLPMAVVSTPREMRDAIARMSDLELVLMDTAGRSPRDEVRIQELRAMLAEAAPDEVHLVLSAVGGAASLARTARQFIQVGATGLILTKLDEATGLGNLLPLLRACELPLCYWTDGQNVPEDIHPADAKRLARLILGIDFSRL